MPLTSQIKVSELARLSGVSLPLISRHFKDFDAPLITKVNNRIIGISPDAAEEYLIKSGFSHLYRPAIILSANLCGGVGKTSSIYNLGAAMRRISGKKIPVVYIDTDPQGSFTSLIFDAPAQESELILIDYLENKASLNDILTEIDENTWFIKSNLSQSQLDKILSKPADQKKLMHRFYMDLLDHFGSSLKVFQDHTPHLSTIFASSVCGLTQLNNNILKTIIIPIRSDNFSINGAEYILNEIEDIKDTFSLEDTIDIHCFFSSIDRRLSTTSDAMRKAAGKEAIMKHLSSVVIRYCSEIPKCIQSSTNVYSSGKLNNAAEDYQDLLQYLLSYDLERKQNG